MRRAVTLPSPRYKVRKTINEEKNPLRILADLAVVPLTNLLASVADLFGLTVAELTILVEQSQLPVIEAAAAATYTTIQAESISLLASGFEGAMVEELAALELGAVFGPEFVNQRAVTWAAVHGGQLITNVTAQQVRTVQMIVSQGITAGRNPRDVARDLRGTIGLDERRARAALNFQNHLINQGMDAAQVQRRTERYMTRLRNDRAETIARTEMIAASNVGQREAWEEAVLAGRLDVSVAEREWFAALDGRTDPICETLDTTRVPWGEEFPEGDPPIHPRCRCSVGLVGANEIR